MNKPLFCYGIIAAFLNAAIGTEVINDNLEVDGNAIFKDANDAANTLNYPWGLRGYRYTFEEGGYNTLTRAYNWHPITAVDRTNGSPSSPSTLINGERIWEFLASGMTPNGVNDVHHAMSILVDGVPSGDNLEVRTKFFTDVMSVRSIGRVGINKPFPDCPLDLWAPSTTRLARFNSSGGIYDLQKVSMRFTSSITNSSSHLYLNDIDNSDSRYLIEALSNGGSRDAFLVTSSGKVGIGTRTPSNALEVNGTVRSKEVIVETSGWPDYVFEEGYELKPLSEVEEHIEESGHLPGVPSAAEVNEGGQSLGASQRLMMQKIEELTLYIIKQDKRIEELERKLDEGY